MRAVVYAERTIKYEIEVEPDPANTVGEAIRVARRAVEEGSSEGVVSFYDVEGILDFDVEVIE
jgi:hypothetical protein